MKQFRNLASPEPMGDWANDPLRACRGLDTEAFFPEWGANGETKRAKKICALCPVQPDCRDYALHASPPVMGIWGGLSERDRQRIRGGLPNPGEAGTVASGTAVPVAGGGVR